jgi:hypothetical protein
MVGFKFEGMKVLGTRPRPVCEESHGDGDDGGSKKKSRSGVEIIELDDFEIIE